MNGKLITLQEIEVGDGVIILEFQHLTCLYTKAG